MRPQPMQTQPAIPEGELIGAEHQVRWYPRSARFSPDESHLLVSLCHFRFGHYCRIARYWISESRWEVLPHEQGVSTAWPDYSPDGQQIVYAQQRCEATYQCSGLGFGLATMASDGTQRRELDSMGVQMPTWSPDGRRLLYWRLNGVARLASGRTLGAFDIYEFSLAPSTAASKAEVRITADSYFGVYTAPRYLPDGEHFLYSAYPNDATSNYAYLVHRDDAVHLALATPRRSIPVWEGRKATFLHAFNPLRGWLVGFPALKLGFLSSGTDRVERFLFDSKPNDVSTADVSPSGRHVVALSSTPMGTMEGGGATSYWKAPPSASLRPVPVMSLIGGETGAVRPIADWPPDVERITQPRSRTSAPPLAQ